MVEDVPEEPIEERFRDLTDLFREHPVAYAGYRISELRSRGKRGSEFSETGEVPLVTTPVFPLAIVGYILYVRAKYFWRSVVGTARTDRLSGDGHLFSMTSSHVYRTHSFVEVAKGLQAEGEEVCLLCSPAAESERESWEQEGLPTTTHRELHRRIGVGTLARVLLSSAVLTRKLWSQSSTHRSVVGLYQYYNFILLEHVKRESVNALTAGSPTVHTFSPMPYLIDSTTPDRLFAYQHGMEMMNNDKCLSLPFFAPMHMLLWGSAWRDQYRSMLHSDTKTDLGGSPWYDYLASRRGEDKRRWDVLFVGGSHGLDDPEIEAEYEQLMRGTVETCEENGYSLATKLHPKESSEWYERRGWGEYVESFDDIDDALLGSRVSVTNSSTAFVESAVLSVPAIVADLFGKGLYNLGPVDYTRFTKGPDVGDAIEEAVGGGKFRSGGLDPLIELGGSRDRIIDVVMERRDPPRQTAD